MLTVPSSDTDNFALSFEVPIVPVGKGRPRFTRSGHAYTPEATRVYEETIGYYAKSMMQGFQPADMPLAVTIVAAMPIPPSYSQRRRQACLQGCEQPAKKPDLDNLVKAVLDACNSIVWKDDAQIVKLTASKTYAATPGVRIIVCRYKLEA